MTNIPQKLTPQERKAAQISEIRARRAANRLDITPQEATKRRAASLAKLRRFDIISVLVLAVVLVILSFNIFEAAKPSAENEAVLNVTLLFWGVIMLQAAIMIRNGFVRMSSDDLLSEDNKDHPFRGWRFTFFTPIIATVILLPAIFAGIYSFDEPNVFLEAIMMLLMSFGAFLMGSLFAAFIIAPVEAILHGVVALIKGDNTKTGFIYFGVFGLAILSIIILGTMAIDPNSPYPAGSFQIALAVLGIPGGYSVDNEVLLWVLRGIIVAMIVVFVWSSKASKKDASSKLAK